VFGTVIVLAFITTGQLIDSFKSITSVVGSDMVTTEPGSKAGEAAGAVAPPSASSAFITITVAGRVVRIDGSPIVGAKVGIDGRSFQATSDHDGRFSGNLKGVTSDAQLMLRVTHINFMEWTRTINGQKNEWQLGDIQLRTPSGR
jgi:hypothetical protein